MRKLSPHHGRTGAKRPTHSTPCVQPATVPLLTLESQIRRGLRRHLRTLGFQKDQDGLLLPPAPTKDAIRHVHALQRVEILSKNSRFIEQRWPELKRHFASGCDLRPSAIAPRLESVEADSWQSDLF